MHVIYYHQYFGTPDGTAGIRSYEFAKALIGRGHRVTMVCGSYDQSRTGLEGPFIRGRREGVVDGIRVVEFALVQSNRDGFLKRSWTFLRFAVGGIREALTRDYDLLFATSTPLTASIPGIVAKLLRRKPFVFEVRDLWPELPREMGVIKHPLVLLLMDWLEWASYRAADACIGLSPGIVRGIVRRGIAPERVVMISNGCDIDLFAEQPAKRPEGTAPGDLVCIFAGAHGIANGLGAVLQAAAELKARGRTDIKLILIGDGKLKQKLQADARQMGLTNVQFLDPIPKRELTGLLRGMDLGLQILQNVPAFYYGTSPNKFFDYLAAGRPVLTNYPGWIADLVTVHQCGFAVPPDDPAAFADALVRAADNRSLLAEMARNAERLAREFTREKLADAFVELLESVAAGTTAGAGTTLLSGSRRASEP